MHINPACPKDSSPRNPTTKERETDSMTAIAVFSKRTIHFRFTGCARVSVMKRQTARNTMITA